MAVDPELPIVHVAVTVIAHGPTILSVYNANWRAYTLPMTKHDPEEEPVDGPWTMAAVRAAAEWLADPFPEPRLLLRGCEAVASGRDGENKLYVHQIFGLWFEQAPKLRPGQPAQWVSPYGFEQRAQPCSATASMLLGLLKEYALECGLTFPDPRIPWPPDGFRPLPS